MPLGKNSESQSTQPRINSGALNSKTTHRIATNLNNNTESNTRYHRGYRLKWTEAGEGSKEYEEAAARKVGIAFGLKL